MAIMTAFQADDAGSIPASRSKLFYPCSLMVKQPADNR